VILVKKFGLKIYNLSIDKKIPADVAYVGRPTLFGNPWSHKKGLALHKVKTVDEAISKFEEYAKINKAIGKQARRHLKGKSLSCWCVPDKCHAQILMEIANSDE
jgi:uncharacterized protein DUF4326